MNLHKKPHIRRTAKLWHVHFYDRLRNHYSCRYISDWRNVSAVAEIVWRVYYKAYQ